MTVIEQVLKEVEENLTNAMKQTYLPKTLQKEVCDRVIQNAHEVCENRSSSRSSDFYRTICEDHNPDVVVHVEQGKLAGIEVHITGHHWIFGLENNQMSHPEFAFCSDLIPTEEA